MSPRAACRLAQLGVVDVFDYVGGKNDWLAHGNVYEGEADLVGRHLQDVATCTVDERVGAVADRVGDADLCVVVGPDRIVLATLTAHELLEHRDAVVADVARYGPTTVRPAEERGALEERMSAKNAARVLVSDPAGRLLGQYLH